MNVNTKSVSGDAKMKLFENNPSKQPDFQVLSRRDVDPYIIAKLTEMHVKMQQHDGSREEIVKRQDQIIKKLDTLSTEVTKMKGFIGGVAFVFAGIGTAVGYVIAYFSGGGLH